MSWERGLLLVLSGPAGSGKTSLAEALLKKDASVRRAVTATTRPPRAGEENGRDYHFIERDEFERRIAAGRFVEYTTFNRNLYGTPTESIDREALGDGVTILVIDVDGAESVRYFHPEATYVFVLPPTVEELERRLVGRGTDSPEDVRRRLDIARREIERISEYHYLIVNDELNVAVRDLEAIIRVVRRSRIWGHEAVDWAEGRFATKQEASPAEPWEFRQ